MPTTGRLGHLQDTADEHSLPLGDAIAQETDMVRGPALVIVFFGLLATGIQESHAQDAALADYFGFDAVEVIRIGRNAGPITVADVDGDGLQDLIAVNNHASRIELHYQKADATPDDVDRGAVRVNEFPEHWRFRRQNLSVTHLVASVVPHDFNGDGLMDLIYAGPPADMVFLAQVSPGVFRTARKHRVKDLAANRDGLAVTDVVGDDRPELLALVGGAIHIWTPTGARLGQPVAKLATGDDMIAFVIEDYDGNGRDDVAGILPEAAAPVRVWFGDVEGGTGTFGPEIRFEMPPLRELETVRLPGDPKPRVATIERASKRIVVYELVTEDMEMDGDRDVSPRVFSFTDPGNRKRDQAVIDVDGDGLEDLVATDTEANALVTFAQAPGKGFQPGASYPCYADIDYLEAANVDDDPYAELFVLSEKEGVVGRCDATADGIPYPSPLNVSDGHTPVALALVRLEAGPHVAVVAKSGREYVIDLIDMEGHRETIELGSQSRSPETIVALDADQDGRTDLLLFTREKPMTMLHAGPDGFTLTESKAMGQFGLVKAARAENIEVYDVDDDGHSELLIADKNFVRAVRYELAPPAGVSPGWQVVTQINAPDSSSKLVSLSVLEDRIIAADRENGRLVIMSRHDEPGAPEGWRATEALNVAGISFTAIHAGAFSGDDSPTILTIDDDGFAVIPLAGRRWAMSEFASWRTSDERRMQHELASGDVNGDGFTDLVSLDAGEQMCEIFTFTESGQMLYVTGFQIYESRIFSGGEPREYEPSQILIADMTGDGADDLVMLSHDRVLMYPQMTDGSD